eukprot:6492034-Pyramimonas_sp.AAC.1
MSTPTARAAPAAPQGGRYGGLMLQRIDVTADCRLPRVVLTFGGLRLGSGAVSRVFPKALRCIPRIHQQGSTRTL